MTLTVKAIQETCCEYFGVQHGDMVSDRRERAIIWPRQTAMYLSRNHTPLSLPEIGRRFGGRDHTTILHAVKKVKARVIADAARAREIEEIAAMLKPPAPATQETAIEQLGTVLMERMRGNVMENLGISNVDIEKICRITAARTIARAIQNNPCKQKAILLRQSWANPDSRFCKAIATVVTSSLELEEKRYTSGERLALARLEKAAGNLTTEYHTIRAQMMKGKDYEFSSND